jgi:tRNA dimethylallyltransferase
MTRPSLIVVVGPTAAGKTALALDVAQQLGAEIVSADSQQVYRGMDIGTGKATAAERARVPHHVIDVVDPDDEMTAARFVDLADAAIAAAAARGNPVVVAGGTGLYVRALLLGLFDGPPAADALRGRMAGEAVAALYARLRDVDPALAERVDANDRKRITRGLEVFELTGEPMSEHQRRHDFRNVEPRYRARLIGLAPDRDELYRRIDARVVAMMDAGFVDEVRGLRDAGYRPPLRSQQAIGYAQLHQHLDGAIPLAEAVRLTQRNTRHYARRQLTWYRPDEGVLWYGARSQVPIDELTRFLHTAD